MNALARVLKDSFNLSVSDAHLRSILDQATSAGGPPDDPWTEGTWRMWLKVKAAQTPPEPDETPTRPKRDLETVLVESSAAILTTDEFEICLVSGWNDFVDEFEDDLLPELFPAEQSISGVLKEQFEEHDGREWLGGAPLASWLYARLAFLGITNIDEENDLGGYQITFVAKAGNRPVGILALDAGSDGVDISLEARTPEVGEKIKDQFIGLLLQEIREIVKCKLEVHGAEVNWTNSYGWTGEYFLGVSNVSG